jgi:hypothetical protein
VTVISQGRSVEHCCFCGRVVLGLQGQDAYLEPYLLRRDGSDEAVVIADMIGACHLKCLLGSGAGTFWAARMKEYYSTPHHARTLRTDGDALACYTKVTKSVAIVRDDGWCATLAAKSLDGARPDTDGNIVLPGESECRFPLEAVPEGDRSLPAALEFGILVDRLNIRGDLLWPRAAAEARVSGLRRAADGAGGTSGNDVFALIEYPVQLRYTDYALACAASGRKAKNLN